MRLLNDVRRLDRHLTRQAASWDSAWARRALPAVESAAEGTKLWWGMAGLMAAAAGRSGRKAAAAGVLSMLTAQLLANAVGKQISDRRRPPKQLIPHDDVEDRPDTSSSLPSGHTAAAVGFAAAVTASSPGLGSGRRGPRRDGGSRACPQRRALSQRRRRWDRHRPGQRLADQPRTPTAAPQAAAITPQAKPPAAE
jgi:membrane-associated phospholipid phosphatase